MVPALPGSSGSPGWVRSRAWIWDFSSTDRTAASSYRRQLILAVLAALAFATTQIAIPLVLRTVIDHGLVGGALGEAAEKERLLTLGVLAFFDIVSRTAS